MKTRPSHKRKHNAHIASAEISLSTCQVIAIVDAIAWHMNEEIDEISPAFWLMTQEALKRRGIFERVHSVDEPPRLTDYGEYFGSIAIEHFLRKNAKPAKKPKRAQR